MAADIPFTIAVCTRNRAGMLERSLMAALAQDFPGAYEILVVDNNSTDSTAQVVQDLAGRHPSVRLLSEPVLGLSRARNRAIDEAQGRWIVYVDDDAALCPGHLSALDRLVGEEGEIGAAGGPIAVGWLEPPPSWWEAGLDIWCNALDHGPERLRIAYPRIIYGTNMAFPVALLREIGGFFPDLGRKGESLMDCEDLEILLRVQKKGLPIFYDPALSVTHTMTPGRLTLEFLQEKARIHGRSRYVAEAMHSRDRMLSALASWTASLARTLVGKGKRSEELIRASALAYLRQGINPR